MKFKNIIFLSIIFCVCLLPFRVDAQIKEIWDKDLDLSDSISASIVKVDDGVILMNMRAVLVIIMY